jgi:Gamma interferon inducible lysosomal thiol reductase (GILT)
MAMPLRCGVFVAAAVICQLVVVRSAENVKVNLYVEALCPFCAKLTTETLASIFKSGVAEIADIRLIPYGNARIDDHVRAHPAIRALRSLSIENAAQGRESFLVELFQVEKIGFLSDAHCPMGRHALRARSLKGNVCLWMG